MNHITKHLGTPKKLAGACEKHGDREITVFGDQPWYCPACLEDKVKAEQRAKDDARRREGLMVTANLPPRYIGERFIAHTEAQKQARGVAKAFMDAAIEGNWCSLVLSGVTGTGKTLLATELAEAYMAKTTRTVKYATASNLTSEIRATYDGGGTKTEESEIRRFSEYGLLILDEIDMMRGSDNDIMLLTEIVNRRYNAGKPVVVITNKSRETLAEFVGERIDDRLYEGGFSIVFAWASFRRR